MGAHFFISFVGHRVTFYDYEIIKSNSLKDFKGGGRWDYWALTKPLQVIM